MGKYAMGVDSGSVSTDFVLIDEKYQLVDSLYLRTHGDPMGTIAQGMEFYGSFTEMRRLRR